MIHEFFRFEGFDADAFETYVSLLRPSRAASADRRAASGGWLVVVATDDDHVLGAIHSSRGRLSTVKSARDLEAIAHVHGASRVFVLREGAVDDLAERIALRVRREQDYLAQLFTVLESMRELERAGTLKMYPGTLARLPLPSPDSVRRVLDLLVADDHVLLLAVYDEHRLRTVLALRRRAGAIDGLFGPRRILPFAKGLEGSFELDHDRLVAAATEAIGPVQLALSMREGVARKILTMKSPGALAAAVAAREVIARPAPPVLAVGVGVDTVASAFYGVGHMLGSTPLGDAFSAAFTAASGLANLPGRESIESWLELFATRPRR